jgi:hypothetical protein
MQPVALPRQTLYRGSLWEEVYHFGPMIDSSGNPPYGECLSCRMQFRTKDTGGLGYELNSNVTEGKGTITIVNGTNYEFDIPAQDLPLNTGSFEWDFETFTTADCTGPSRTWYRGAMTVIKDISHD